MSTPARAARPDCVLVVCSANQCRSPLAGAFLAREVALHGLPVDVVTAGFRARPGSPATRGTREAAEHLGIDLSPHRSRAVDVDLLAGADLVVGMERLHVREAVVLEPAVWRRSFTLPELVRRAEGHPPRSPGVSLGVWAAEMSAGRDRMSLMGASTGDDVRDPTTDRGVDHPETAALLDDLVRRLVSRAWPA